MKKLIAFSLVCFSAFNSPAQHSFVGDWHGTLHAGIDLNLAMHIKDEGNHNLSGMWDSPDQKVFGRSCSSVSVSGDSVFIGVQKINASYKGKFIDDTAINGAWTQGGHSLPLNLVKGLYVKKELKRPQTPKPPFDYISDDIIYHNADNTIQYSGTITIPKGDGPFPALLLITGSGQENRDEEILGHKPFAVIADYLTKRGYIVLRVDDRGIGKSTGDVANATSADFAKDVMASLDYLKTRKEVDADKLGLLGHSEGGMLAQMVAVQRSDVTFIISLAGPGEKIAKLMEDQNAAIFLSSGIDQKSIDTYLSLFRNMERSAIINSDPVMIKASIARNVQDWRAKTSKEIVQMMTEITDSANEAKFVDQVAAQFSSPWFHYFIAYDPGPVIEQLHCKVLALNGTKDVQVVSTGNITGWKASLAKSKSKVHDVIELPGLNHLFQKCIKCTVDEYGDIEETMDPSALQTIGDWLDKHVK